MAYTREVEGGGGGGGGILPNSRALVFAPVWAVQVGRSNERTIHSCTNDSK